MSMKRLTVRLEDSFLDRYPHTSIHVLVAGAVDQIDPNVVQKWRDLAQKEVSSWHIDPQRLVEEPWIAVWRTAIKKMGLSAAKTRSSIEQLAKRALSGNFISIPVQAVNLYCHVSLIAQTPMGGYAIDSLTDTVWVRLSRPGDTFLGLGEREPIQVPSSVVLYADDKNVACFAWNHRDSVHTCLKTTTQSAIFFADACSAENRCHASQAITLLAESLQEGGAIILSRGLLDSSVRQLDLATEAPGISDAAIRDFVG
jgi:DNA/RNA-binding domain of Phe-tRNA-synthetase-like protein